jgi:hypothetical protein
LRLELSQAMETAGAQEYSDESDAASEKLAFGIEASLRAIVSCLEALRYDVGSVCELQLQVMDLVLEIMEDGDLDLTDLALQIFDRVVYVAKDSLHPQGWAVFDAMVRVLLDGAVDLFASYVSILDNLCSHQPMEFCRPERLEKVYNMVVKMLSKDISATPHAVSAAPELMTCMFLQLRPYRPAMDTAAGPLLTLTLQSLVAHEAVEIRVGLCTVLMSALFYDPAATLAVTDESNATAFLFPSYCDLMERPAAVEKHLSTALGRKAHVVGICAYLRFAIENGRPETASVAGRLVAICAQFVKANLQSYESQLATLNDLVSGQAAARNRQDGDEGFESDDSMDDEENEEGANDDEDNEGNGSTRRRATGDDDDEGSDADDELDVESSLDTLCEVSMLFEMLGACPTDVQGRFISAWPTALADMSGATSLSQQVIAARAQFRSTAAELHSSRATAAA